MNPLNWYIGVTNILLPLISFLVVIVAIRHLYEYSGEIPEMWIKIMIGLLFIVLSEGFGITKMIYEQSAFHLDFFTQVFKIVGVTYLFIGIMPHLREIVGE